MSESIFGWTAAPHPTATEQWTLTAVLGETEAGTFDIVFDIAGTTVTVADVAADAAAATIQTDIRAAHDLLTGATATGGAMGTSPVVLDLGVSPVTVTVDGTNFTDASTVEAELTAEGQNTIVNETVLNPTGADRVDGTLKHGTYDRQYGHLQTPNEEMKDFDGSTITSGGGVTAVAP